MNDLNTFLPNEGMKENIKMKKRKINKKELNSLGNIEYLSRNKTHLYFEEITNNFNNFQYKLNEMNMSSIDQISLEGNSQIIDHPKYSDSHEKYTPSEIKENKNLDKWNVSKKIPFKNFNLNTESISNLIEEQNHIDNRIKYFYSGI